MTEVVLGEHLQVVGWAFRGTLPPDKLAKVLKGAVERMGMTTNGMKPVICQYPLPDGKGGVGHTIYLPFGDPGYKKPGLWGRLSLALAKRLMGRRRFAATVFQPLVESFIVADDYPELDKTYILAASCKPFISGMVSRYLVRNIGPILNTGGFVL